MTRAGLFFYPRNSAENGGYGGERGHYVGNIPIVNIYQFLARFFLQARYNAKMSDNWRSMCIGTYSRSEETGQHTPLLDYDGKHIKTVVRHDIQTFQKEFGLKSATIYKTRRGNHVYFFDDQLPWETYKELLQKATCCAGFRQSSINRKGAVLRVSGKYTEFDLELEEIIRDPRNELVRPSITSVLIKALIQMGIDHQTHIASLFPQWASYTEDQTPWRMRRKVSPHAKGKYIKKIPNELAIPMPQDVAVAPEPAPEQPEPNAFLYKMYGVEFINGVKFVSTGDFASSSTSSSNTFGVYYKDVVKPMMAGGEELLIKPYSLEEEAPDQGQAWQDDEWSEDE